MSYSDSSVICSLERHFKCIFPIPEGYKFVQILGQGCFGVVLLCVEEESGEFVAIKVFTEATNAQWEAHIMTTLMQHNLESSNIIRYEGAHSVAQTISLVFEVLDISLQDYLNMVGPPMLLKDIRIIIQQMAVAFDALKSVGVIHGDLKLNNIMMVDHIQQPLRIKLIDFGLAVHRWRAVPGKTLQATQYRAPEIILGLLFSEAIDIWSLGCIMAFMMFGVKLFPANTEYYALRFITDLLGPPPQHLLNIGKKTSLFYKKIDDQWELKTSEEYCPGRGNYNATLSNRIYKFRTLDETKMVRLERYNPREADERRECVELLKAMLKWDEQDRITPSGILNHPFITQSYLNDTSNLSGPSSNGPEATTNQKQMDVGTKDIIIEALPPSVILVQPADPENRIHLGDVPNEVPDQSSHEALPPSVILVQPADPENRTHLEDVPNEVPDQSSHEALPPSVILVQPADPENRIHLGDVSSEDSDQSSHEALPPSVILVQPADPESRTHLGDVSSKDSDQSSHSTPDPASTDDTISNYVDTYLPRITSDYREAPKKKKKKNRFRCFLSWLNKTFSCVVLDTME